jgi:hypothetical protein
MYVRYMYIPNESDQESHTHTLLFSAIAVKI